MIINDRRGDMIARHHEAIEINSIRLAIKLLMALIRLLADLKIQQNKTVKAEPVEMTAKLDGKTVLKATVEPNLLSGTNPALLTGSNPEEFAQQGLPPSPNLPLLEAVEYIDAEVLERHADSLMELAELPPGSTYEEPGIKSFEVIDGKKEHLFRYKEGKVEENVLYISEQATELAPKEVNNLPEKVSAQPKVKTEQVRSEQELTPVKTIEDERLAKLAELIVRYRDREEGKVADGRNYRIERKEGNITILAQDGRGEIFSSSKNGYKNKLSAQDYENFGKIDQFVINMRQKQQQQASKVERTPPKLELQRVRTL